MSIHSNIQGCVNGSLLLSPWPAVQILICDEPTTALDQPFKRKSLICWNPFKKNDTTYSYLYHPRLRWLQVLVDKVAAMYAGEILSLVSRRNFLRSKLTHGALLRFLPQLSTSGWWSLIYSRTPPSLYAPIKGDAFCTPVQTMRCRLILKKRQSAFKVTDTHC